MADITRGCQMSNEYLRRYSIFGWLFVWVIIGLSGFWLVEISIENVVKQPQKERYFLRFVETWRQQPDSRWAKSLNTTMVISIWNSLRLNNKPFQFIPKLSFVILTTSSENRMNTVKTLVWLMCQDMLLLGLGLAILKVNI